MNDLNLKQKDIPELDNLEEYRYENLFNVFQTSEGYYGYNIGKKIIFPNNIETELYNTVVYNGELWPVLSFKYYGSIHLWWLIIAVNNIQNPFILPPKGTGIKMLKRKYLRDVIDQVFNT